MADVMYGEVAQSTLRALGDGNTAPLPMSRMGLPAVLSKWDHFALGGRMFNLKQTTIGTELSGATAAASTVLTVPWVRFTVPTGYTIFPRHLNLSLTALAGTANEIALIYTNTDSFTSSAGVALTPRNWRPDADAASSIVENCYIGASGGVNTEAALGVVRALYQEGMAAAYTASFLQHTIDQWFEDLIPIVGPSSVLLYLTGNGTTPAGFFSMDWAEVPTSAVKA